MCVAACGYVGIGTLAVNASALAPADSIASVALGWLPLTYLDVARVVGTVGYGLISGCGCLRLAACIVLAVSLRSWSPRRTWLSVRNAPGPCACAIPLA